ncbi:hypothetical protein ACFQV4_28520 [Streptomyces thermocarboxydus]
MLDSRGRIAGRNRAARRLTASSASDVPPSWLAEAHRRHVAGTVDPTAGTGGGPVGDRSFEARPSPPGTAVAWWLFDRTDLVQAHDRAGDPGAGRRHLRPLQHPAGVPERRAARRSPPDG